MEFQTLAGGRTEARGNAARILLKLFPALPGYQGMNTLLKILLLAVLVVLAFHFAPILLVPIVLLAAGLIALWITVSVAAIILLIVALALIAGLSPIWIPVLALVGLIALCRSGSRRAVARS